MLSRLGAIAGALLLAFSYSLYAQPTLIAPLYFVSHGENWAEIFKLLNVNVGPQFTRLQFEQRVQNLNRHVTALQLAGTLPTDQLLVLPDPRNPETGFVWFTSNRVDQLLQEMARRGANSPEVERILKRVSLREDGLPNAGLYHVYFVTDVEDDVDLWIAGNFNVAARRWRIFLGEDKYSLYAAIDDYWFEVLAKNTIQ